jgi:hypothetical protein
MLKRVTAFFLCGVLGKHRVFPDCGSLYCTRCYKWNDLDGEGWQHVD